MKTIQQRFEEKCIPDPKTGCWTWTAALKSKDKNNNYGLFRIGSRIRKAHQVSWEIYRGEIPKTESYHGTCVCHKCDSPQCVNPGHLFLGTMQDNNKDKVDKLRTPRGSAHHSVKLTEDQVVDIKKLTGTLPQKDIAAMFGVAWYTISSIQRGVNWSHI